MIMRGALALVICILVSKLSAEFGSYAEIKSAHPEFFTPASVSVVTNGGVAHYVYSGRARLLFGGKQLATLPQLREAAQLRAEGNLSRHLQKGESKHTMTLRASRQIAKEIDGEWVTYVFAVPVDNVTIRPQPPAVGRAQTNETAGTVVPLDAGAPVDTNKDERVLESLLPILDQVDGDPNNAVLLAKLAKEYFGLALYDEAVETAGKAQTALLLEVTPAMSEEKVCAILSAAAVLKDCGESRKARDGYCAVLRVGGIKHRAEAQQALAQIESDIGSE